MTTEERVPLLLTPGPLTTSAPTKHAMLRDWGSRDAEFVALTARVRRSLLDIVGGADGHVVVPIQGSGTFAIEATIGTLVPANGKLLVLVNGAYGRRIVRIAERLGRANAVLETPEDVPWDAATVADALARDRAVTHVAAVHCETTSGMLNPLAEMASAVAVAGRRLLVDAMSSFGAIPLDAGSLAFDAVVASANKCLEGVPGLAFAVIRRAAIEGAEGNAPSLSLDLCDQWRFMEETGQWRFTPPTHVVAALAAALDAHAAEGGVAGRGMRYGRNCAALVDGMRALGFVTFLPERLRAPVIVTFRMPADASFDFEIFYAAMAERGFLIYPGKLSLTPSFRIGCMGQVDEADLQAAVEAVRASLTEMGVASGTPAAA